MVCLITYKLLQSSQPKVENGFIKNKGLPEAIMESMIGEHGVSPEAKEGFHKKK